MAASKNFSAAEVSRLEAAGRISFSKMIGPAGFQQPAVNLLDELVLTLCIAVPEVEVSSQLRQGADIALAALGTFEQVCLVGRNTGETRLRVLFEAALQNHFGAAGVDTLLKHLSVAREIVEQIRTDHVTKQGRPTDDWIELACAEILKVHEELGGSTSPPYDKAPYETALKYPNFGFIVELAEILHEKVDRGPNANPETLRHLVDRIRSKARSVKPLRKLIERAYKRIPQLTGSFMLSGGRIHYLDVDDPWAGDD